MQRLLDNAWVIGAPSHVGVGESGTLSWERMEERDSCGVVSQQADPEDIK